MRGGHCPQHQSEQPTRSRPPGSQAFYNSHHWQKLRRLIRQRDPICKECKRKPSQSVDHIDGDWRNNDPGNLRGICNDCHASKSGKDHNLKRNGAYTP